MKTKPAEHPHAARRRLIFKEMPSELQEAAREVEKNLNLIDRGTTLAMYDVGAIVDRIANAEHVFGSLAVPQLADYTGIAGGMRTLNNWRGLAMDYPVRQYLVDEIRKPMANGRSLSVHHFMELASIRSYKERAQLLVRIREECMSVKDLRDEITATDLRRSEPRGPGREMSRPKSPAAGLHRFSTIAGQVVKYGELLDDAVFQALLEGQSDEPAEELRTCLVEAETAAADAQEMLRHVVNRLRAVREHIDPLPPDLAEAVKDTEEGVQGDSGNGLQVMPREKQSSKEKKLQAA